MLENFDYIINLIKNISEASESDTSEIFETTIQQSNNTTIPDDPDSEKKKKIIKILLLIFLLLIGGFFLYYTFSIYFSEIQPIFSIETALEQLKTLLPKERYDQICITIHEMENRPDKVKAGIQLLHIIKLLLKTDLPEGQQGQFEKIMNKIISYFEKEE